MTQNDSSKQTKSRQKEKIYICKIQNTGHKCDNIVYVNLLKELKEL